MSRLRYIVDMPRGPRGGHNDVRHMYTWVESAKRALESGTRGLPKGVTSRVLQIDLDDLLVVHPGPDFDALFQWHETRATHHAAEAMRMREAESSDQPQAKWLTSEDITKLREVAARYIEEFERGVGKRKSSGIEHHAFFVLRDLMREGKLGGAR